MTRPQLTDSEVLQLAIYAHAALAPLITEAQTLEPSIELHLDLVFGNPGVDLGEGHIDVIAHWGRASLFVYSIWHQTEADIDALAAEVEASIEKLRAEAA